MRRRNNDWNKTNEHFSSERVDRDRQNDLARNSRTDEYDRYGYNRQTENDFQSSPYRESDSWDSSRGSTSSGRSFYHNNSGNYGMSNSHGARSFDNRYGNSSHDNFSNNSFAQNDFRNTERSGHYGKGPKGWKRSDERIKDEVSEALYRDQHIDATNIEVAVKEGTVTLSGTIDSRFGKRHAEECVEHLSGVEDVQNEIKILRQDNGSSSSSKEPLRKLS